MEHSPDVRMGPLRRVELGSPSLRRPSSSIPRGGSGAVGGTSATEDGLVDAMVVVFVGHELESAVVATMAFDAMLVSCRVMINFLSRTARGLTLFMCF